MTPYVLIVDDDPDTQEVMRDIVSAVGLDSRCAADGLEALAKVREELPSLILLDLMMPRMDGFSLFARLRGLPQTRHIPVIVVSAIERDQVDFLRLPGVTEVVQKGQFSVRELIELVKSTLQRDGQGVPQETRL